MPDFLLELGTEELPASAVAQGEVALGRAVASALAEARLEHAEIETFATPRRLAVLVRGVAAHQASMTEERRGPPVSQAFHADGTFAPSATGFARANGIQPEVMERRVTPAGEYLFAIHVHEGHSAADVLPDAIAAAIGSLSFPKSMHWDDSKVKFPRPMRWIVAMLDDSVVPVTHGELTAGNMSRGHRVLHPDDLEISSAAGYEADLRKASVYSIRKERRLLVTGGAHEAATELGGTPVLSDAVVNEVTDLVEKPSPLPGRFDSGYLELPRDVLITVLQSHQRLFAVEKDGALINGFVAVSNGDAQHRDVIIAGNERVVRARLEDARFFFAEDMKTSLSDRAANLGEIVLHGKLGTMRDKVLRLGSLLVKVTGWLGLSDDESDAAFLAADVAKADLTTRLVFEFPELQGIIGREYTLRDSEPEDPKLREQVAQTIADHYLPRHTGDAMPHLRSGAALGLADRLDTLVGYIGIGMAVSGTQDPYKLRRAATGFAAVSIHHDARIPLAEAARAAHEQYTRAGIELAPVDDVAAAVARVLELRTQWLLSQEGVETDFIKAARQAHFHDLPDLAARARALHALHQSGRLHGLAVANERCSNLSKSGPHGDVDEALLEHESEHNLFLQLTAVEEIAMEFIAARDYASALEALVVLSHVVDDLFDRERGVMIMVEDENVRRNRLALLERTAKIYAAVADFSAISPALLEASSAR